jgi:hypothetical protein
MHIALISPAMHGLRLPHRARVLLLVEFLLLSCTEIR